MLINNAGIANMNDGPPSKTSIDALESLMKTNFVGSCGYASYDPAAAKRWQASVSMMPGP